MRSQTKSHCRHLGELSRINHTESSWERPGGQKLPAETSHLPGPGGPEAWFLPCRWLRHGVSRGPEPGGTLFGPGARARRTHLQREVPTVKGDPTRPGGVALSPWPPLSLTPRPGTALLAGCRGPREAGRDVGSGSEGAEMPRTLFLTEDAGPGQEWRPRARAVARGHPGLGGLSAEMEGGPAPPPRDSKRRGRAAKASCDSLSNLGSCPFVS